MYNRQSTIKQDLIQDSNEPSYWTQYNRTHNLLGAKRGVGIAREYPNRISYNVITGIIQLIRFKLYSHWILTEILSLQAKRINNQVGSLRKGIIESQVILPSMPKE